MRILFIGDIFCCTGKRAVKQLLFELKNKYQIDYVIANAENVTNCRGIDLKDYNELISYGIDFFTMGNHTWDQEDIWDLLVKKSNLIRPYNIDPIHKFSHYGSGTKVIKIKDSKIRITNLIGSSVCFKNIQTNPFIALQKIIDNDNESDFHIVDFHAESTSEKNALFYDFQGKVSAIVGTHTHIQTADNRIRNNTAFITDVGSTGPSEGVIGAKASHITKYLKQQVDRIRIEEEVGLYQFCAVVIELNEKQRLVNKIERILIYEN